VQNNRSGAASAVATDTHFTESTEQMLDAARMDNAGMVNLAASREIAVATIRLLLVDDHALVREGLRRLLELEEDVRVVGEATNGLDALHLARTLKPDVALMDISMPSLDGITVMRRLYQESPSVAVIMLTMYRQQQHILQAMRGGARGYVLKSASSQEMLSAIRKVHQGGTFISSELTGEIVNEYRRLSDGATPRPSIHALSEKEIEIIRGVATGMSNREIADKLAYSEKTVKNYLSIIFQKLGIRDRTQAAIFALRQGLIPQEEWE